MTSLLPTRAHLVAAALVFGIGAGLTGPAAASHRSKPVLSPIDFAGDTCILTASTRAAPGLTLNSGASVVGRHCSVHVRSRVAPAAIFNSQTEMKVEDVCVAGKTVISNAGVIPNLTTDCSTVRDPWAGTLPQPTGPFACDVMGRTFNAGAVSLEPGVHCGRFTFNSRTEVTLAPGLYILRDGDWIVNGASFSGEGVSLYFLDGNQIRFNSGARVDLSAPAKGTYKDVLIHAKARRSVDQFVIGASDVTLRGLVYLPKRDVIANGGSNLVGDRFSLVARTVTLNGASWSLTPNKGQELFTDGSCGEVTVPTGFQGLGVANDVNAGVPGVQVNASWRYEPSTGRVIMEAVADNGQVRILGRTNGHGDNLKQASIEGCLNDNRVAYVLGENMVSKKVAITPQFNNGSVKLMTTILR
jgi:hypothetical protein